MSGIPCTIGTMCVQYRGHFGWHCPFDVQTLIIQGGKWSLLSSHLTMFIIRNVYYHQCSLYTPHCPLELSSTALSLHETQHFPLHIHTYLILLLPPHTYLAILPSVSSSFQTQWCSITSYMSLQTEPL